MSSQSKYSGLAGTILLGTLLGLNYTQYAKRKHPLSDKGAAYDPSEGVSTGSFFDKEGNIVPLGQTNLPGINSVRKYREYIPANSILLLSGALSVWWTVRSFFAMNKVLAKRYDDVVYQIRRPDVIANRLVAWKYLGVGGMVVPVSFLLVWYSLSATAVSLELARSNVGDSLSSLSKDVRRIGGLSALNFEKTAFSTSVTEFTKTLKDGFRP